MAVEQQVLNLERETLGLGLARRMCGEQRLSQLSRSRSLYGWASPNNPTAQPHLGRRILPNTGSQVKLIVLIEGIRET